jgi:hypothetical protein
MVIECVMNQVLWLQLSGQSGLLPHLQRANESGGSRLQGHQDDQRATVTVGTKKFRVTPGTTISHYTFLPDDLTDNSYCSNSMLEFLGSHKIGGQMTQVVYKITVLKVVSR